MMSGVSSMLTPQSRPFAFTLVVMDAGMVIQNLGFFFNRPMLPPTLTNFVVPLNFASASRRPKALFAYLSIVHNFSND